MRGVLALVIVLLMLLPVTRVQGQELSVLISRNASVTTVYFSVPASVVSGMTYEVLTTQGPTFAHAQMATTSHMAELAAASSLISADGQLHTLRSRSALVHETNDPLPFNDPFDASVATAVCATPRALLPPMETLRLYASFVSDAGVDVPLIAFALPRALANVTSVDLRVFDKGVLTYERIVAPSADGYVPLDLSAARSVGASFGFLVFIAGLLLAFGAGWRSLVLLRRSNSVARQR